MTITGKILFFNATDGKGILITSNKDKLHFRVEEWDDFDVMPSLGLLVQFSAKENQAFAISALNEDQIDEFQIEEPIEEKKLDNEAEDIPVAEETIEVVHEKQVQEDEIKHDETDEEYSVEHFDENTEEENQTTNLEDDDREQNDSIEHFEEDEEIEKIEDVRDFTENLEERESSVTLSLNLPLAVKNYFDVIQENIKRREKYKKVQGRLDFLIIRRFLWTTFNNINEIDIDIINPNIRAMKDDLKSMASVYDDFSKKIRHPSLAYEEVFLSCQAEYVKIKDGVNKTIEHLNRLKGSEKTVGGILQIRKKELSINIRTQEFEAMKNELKSLNGAYVDIVHLMAELDERYKHDLKLLVDFEDEYREDFYKIFNATAIQHKANLVDILNAQAFNLDSMLWQAAKKSKSLKAHFHKAGIEGEFSTKTFLKYYLDSQDANKMTEEAKKLHECYEYLLSIEKEYVMIVCDNAKDAMDYESEIKKLDKSCDPKAFISEKKSLKWAMRNTVKVLILEERLATMPATNYLKYYKKYISAVPKIILIGNSIKTDEYTIDKSFSAGVYSRVLAKSVQEFLADKKQENDDTNI